MLTFGVFLVGTAAALTTRKEEKPNNYSLCMRTYPQQGTWLKTNQPPFYQPDNCPPMKSYNRDELVSCMSGRTVHVMGNSVARQFAFAILPLLDGGTVVSRESQKQICMKGQLKGYSCLFHAGSTTVKYLYKNTFDGYLYNGNFPFFYPDNVTYDESQRTQKYRSNNATFQKKIEHLSTGGMNHGLSGYLIKDNCDAYDHGDDTSSCLRDFFNSSSSSDLLIFSVGFYYSEIAAGKNTPIDYKSWVIHSAVKFWTYIERWFPGQVIWFTTPPCHPQQASRVMNPGIKQVNDILWDIWRPHAGKRMWYVIDQGAINTGRFHMYEDHIHFQGPLTLASLYNIFNVVCAPKVDGR
jgi:hypothetical protein